MEVFKKIHGKTMGENTYSFVEQEYFEEEFTMITNEIYHTLNYGVQFFWYVVVGCIFLASTNNRNKSYRNNNSKSKIFCMIAHSGPSYSFFKSNCNLQRRAYKK
jgi:hypothetical protein